MVAMKVASLHFPFGPELLGGIPMHIVSLRVILYLLQTCILIRSLIP